MARDYWRALRCSSLAAHAHVFLAQAHPLAYAYWRTSRCLPLAAFARVILFQGDPWIRAYFRTARSPPPAKKSQCELANAKGVNL